MCLLLYHGDRQQSAEPLLSSRFQGGLERACECGRQTLLASYVKGGDLVAGASVAGGA
jgi:hypothetical protein